VYICANVQMCQYAPGEGTGEGGSARQLRLRPPAVTFALGEAIELQDDDDVVGEQRDLDLAAQSAQLALATIGLSVT